MIGIVLRSVVIAGVNNSSCGDCEITILVRLCDYIFHDAMKQMNSDLHVAPSGIL